MTRPVTDGTEKLLKGAVSSGLTNQLATRWPTHHLYWRLAKRFYRRRRPFDVDEYEVPVDPLGVARVSPDRIVRMTGRKYPWERARDNFGAVRGGDWDVRPPPDLPRGHEDRPWWQIQTAENFEETVLHQSLEAHFRDGVPWKETEFIRKALWIVEHDFVWHCSTAEEIRERCAYIDRVYDDIKENGYKSQRELAIRNREWPGFERALTDEILVDVARDGELLFVDSRHRLSIAKILGLDEVPVVFQVRHPEWMSHLEDVYWSETDSSHPDLRERATL